MVGTQGFVPVFPAGKGRPVTSRRGKTVSRLVRQFVERLSREERVLVLLKRELYEGSWENMAADLNARLEGRPYVFKMATRIQEDLERIERLAAFETLHNVDLADFVPAQI
jgi:hypothetical protein